MKGFFGPAPPGPARSQRSCALPGRRRSSGAPAPGPLHIARAGRRAAPSVGRRTSAIRHLIPGVVPRGATVFPPAQELLAPRTLRPRESDRNSVPALSQSLLRPVALLPGPGPTALALVRDAGANQPGRGEQSSGRV